MIRNGDFALGRTGSLPEGWELKTPYDFLKPDFGLVEKDGLKLLEASGGGNPDCLGWLSTPVEVQGGKTYRLRARLKISEDLNPHQSLIFAFHIDQCVNDGIVRFHKKSDGWIEGETRFAIPGEGVKTGDARLYFRYSAEGRAWISEVSMEECAPVEPRMVKVACSGGGKYGDLEAWADYLKAAGEAKADIVLLTETFNGTENAEPIDGPSAQLMSKYARDYGMYVSGTFVHKDAKANRVYNSCVIYDRNGELVGRYDKNHPYSPEAFLGVTPGLDVPVFKTDFGKVGMIICYDNWFGDVTELLALRGAEIILFPSAGYCRGLMPARSSDNCVRFVASSTNCGCGVWDTAGTEVTNPGIDPTQFPGDDKTYFDPVKTMVGEIEMLTVTLDLSKNPSPHNWGGPMLSAAGGRRNRRDQKALLYDEIKAEVERWWEED